MRFRVDKMMQEIRVELGYVEKVFTNIFGSYKAVSCG